MKPWATIVQLTRIGQSCPLFSICVVYSSSDSFLSSVAPTRHLPPRFLIKAADPHEFRLSRGAIVVNHLYNRKRLLVPPSLCWFAEGRLTLRAWLLSTLTLWAGYLDRLYDNVIVQRRSKPRSHYYYSIGFPAAWGNKFRRREQDARGLWSPAKPPPTHPDCNSLTHTATNAPA